MSPQSSIDIIDIRSPDHDDDLTSDPEARLLQDPPEFSPMLLWDEAGLKKFEAVTYSDRYYLTDCEIELHEEHKNEIAQEVPPNSVVVELGSG